MLPAENSTECQCGSNRDGYESGESERYYTCNKADTDAVKSHETATLKGFWDETATPSFVLSKIALIHSECSELLEAIRKDKGSEEILYEIADIYIRTVDLYEGLKKSGYLPEESSLSEVIAEKMAINEGRPRKHGNLA